MLSSGVFAASSALAILTSLITSISAQSIYDLNPMYNLNNRTYDYGNGVHIPGAIPANVYEPLQHHLAYGSDYSTMYVSWASFHYIDTPTVLYGTNPSNLNLLATSSESRIYPTSRTYNNHVKLTGLSPNTLYYYQVSYTNAAYAAYRPKYTFKTALKTGDRTPFSIAAFGDLGLMGHDGLSSLTGPLGGSTKSVLGTNETNTIQSLLLMKDSYEFIAHFGDIGYADYFLRGYTQDYFGNNSASLVPDANMIADRYESLNEQFFDQMEPITATVPWMVSPGNHEANCDNGGYSPKSGPGVNTYTDQICMVGQTNFTFYIEKFRMPGEDSGGVSNFWYSYNYGMVHFVSLDTETDLPAGGPIQNATNNHNGPFGRNATAQVQWLKADLAKVDRSITPWVVALLHRPFYTSVNSPSSMSIWQQAFEEIFYAYGVDIYMQGHVHAYERFNPIYNGTVDPAGFNNPRAPWPIVAGGAGHYDGLDTFTQPRNISYGVDSAYGWTKLNFLDAEHARLDFYASANSTVIDSQTLYKSRSGNNSTMTTSMPTMTMSTTTAGASSTGKPSPPGKGPSPGKPGPGPGPNPPGPGKPPGHK